MMVYNILSVYFPSLVRLWCSLRRWPRGATNSVQIHWNCGRFIPSFNEDGRLWIRWIHWLWSREEIGRSLIQFHTVCQGRCLPTQDHGEPNRKLCHRQGDWPLVDSLLQGVPEVQPSYPRSCRAQEDALPLILVFTCPWRVQEGALSSSWNFAEEPIWFSHLFVRMCVVFEYLLRRVRVSLWSRDKE